MAAYYNDTDPAAASVLRALIARNIIAPGDVDTRSIKEVSQDDIKGYVQCHFFAGGGLWSIAARLAGWPDDKPIWSGSCPCQPFSVAGKGAGAEDPRHLWPDFFRLISSRRPPVVVGEQVAGKAGRDWFYGVRTDLEGCRYAGRAVDVPACSVDTPHIRQRLYWIATDLGDPDCGRGSAWELAAAAVGHRRSAFADGCAVGMADASCRVGGRRSDEPQRGEEGRIIDRGARASGVAQGDAYSPRQFEYGGPESVRAQQPSAERAGGAAREGVDQVDASSNRWGERRPEYELRSGRPTTAVTGRPNGSFWSDHEWRLGPDGKARRVKPGLRLLVDGLPGRVDLLRIGGNAIVPQLAAEVLAAFLDVEVAP